MDRINAKYLLPSSFKLFIFSSRLPDCQVPAVWLVGQGGWSAMEYDLVISCLIVFIMSIHHHSSVLSLSSPPSLIITPLRLGPGLAEIFIPPPRSIGREASRRGEHSSVQTTSIDLAHPWLYPRLILFVMLLPHFDRVHGVLPSSLPLLLSSLFIPIIVSC